MNCDEVQERLSEYLERALDEGNLRSVESHLSSCRLCRAEAVSLALCIGSIANLHTVEPPIGFTQRVMSHVREI
jgi:predicted anti-sigma-YlaC factor YlaD